MTADLRDVVGVRGFPPERLRSGQGDDGRNDSKCRCGIDEEELDMSVAIISGSAGLIGSEAARHFAGLGYDIVGIDNNMRERLFGSDGSIDWQRTELRRTLKRSYRHCDFDIRDADAIDGLFSKYGSTITLVIHAAAQPSHDWAAREPKTDFSINAVGYAKSS